MKGGSKEGGREGGSEGGRERRTEGGKKVKEERSGDLGKGQMTWKAQGE